MNEGQRHQGRELANAHKKLMSLKGRPLQVTGHARQHGAIKAVTSGGSGGCVARVSTSALAKELPYPCPILTGHPGPHSFQNICEQTNGSQCRGWHRFIGKGFYLHED